MYGRGSLGISALTTGASSTIAGIIVLPNTGGNIILMILSGLSVIVGGLVVASFIAARLAKFYYR